MIAITALAARPPLRDTRDDQTAYALTWGPITGLQIDRLRLFSAYTQDWTAVTDSSVHTNSSACTLLATMCDSTMPSVGDALQYLGAWLSDASPGRRRYCRVGSHSAGSFAYLVTAMMPAPVS